MKVNELIQKLNEFDGDLEVFMYELQDAYKSQLLSVKKVELGTVYNIDSQSKEDCIHIGG